MRVGTAGLAAALVGVAAVGAASAAVVSRVTSKTHALNSNESTLTDAQRNELYHHAFLLLRRDPFVAGDFALEFYTGEYPIDGAGIVSVVPGNPFGSQLSGMSIAAVESLAAASAGTG